MAVLVYHWEPGHEPALPPVPARHTFETWRPSWRRVVPSGMALWPYGVWWLFHHTRMFANREYAVVLRRDGARVVHRSCVFPGDFRFPFMAPDDLQVGDTWTDPGWRNQGLASEALRFVCDQFGRPGRRLWYVVEETNTPSIRAVERASFRRFGRGAKRKRFGLRMIGSYRVEASPPDVIAVSSTPRTHSEP